MIEFPQDYFEDEVRDGFYVNGLMKRCWAAQIEVLSDIASVCEKYNIKWYADCGTLLGAVRHGGFVPWDDDLDICMFRDDYMRFIAVAEKELKKIWKGYKLFNFRNGDYWEVISRVVDMHALSFEEDRTSKFHGFPLEVGIDIFPLDYLCNNRKKEEERMAICNSIFSIADDKRLKKPDKYINEMLFSIEMATGRKFDRKKSLQMQLYLLGEEMFSLYDRKQAEYGALMGYWLKDESHKYDLKWYEHTVMMPFENIKIPVPAGYDSALKTEYGDYMKIVRTGGAHDYPRYENQIKQLEKEMGDESPFAKRIPKDLLINEPIDSNPRKAVKDQLNELTGLLAEAHDEIRRMLTEDDMESAFQLLTDCQNTAIYIGTTIEDNYDEGHPTVKHLEDYCELVYHTSEVVGLETSPNNDESQGCAFDSDSADDEKRASFSVDDLDAQLTLIKESIDTDIKVRKEIVFLPYKADQWKYIEGLWEKYSSDPEADVYVIPIPYYYKSAAGKLEEEKYDGDMFPEKVIITDYRDYDFKERRPDIIFIQNPFDGDNFSMTVHPYFYAERMKRYTDQLIYVQSFVCEEINRGEERAYKAMTQYAVSPGVIYADKVLVQSEHMKEMYVKKLTEYYGDETKDCWETKIIGKICDAFDDILEKNNIRETDKCENNFNSCFRTERGEYKQGLLYEELLGRAYRDDGSRKKVVLYNTSVSGLYENGEKMLEKMHSVFATFKDNADDVLLIWRPDPLIDEVISKADNLLYEKYEQCRDKFVADDLGILVSNFDNEDAITIISSIDAYYGDTDKLVTMCTGRKIPVMIQNVDV